MSVAELGDGRYLIDNSIYARAGHPSLSALFQRAARKRQLVVCGALAIEALYSARDGNEVERLHERLTVGMPWVEIDDAVWRLALATQVELGKVVERFHRRPPIDYLIAATAHHHELGVLHYDRDYDLVAEHSSLEFESRWVAEPGSL